MRWVAPQEAEAQQFKILRARRTDFEFIVKDRHHASDRSKLVSRKVHKPPPVVAILDRHRCSPFDSRGLRLAHVTSGSLDAASRRASVGMCVYRWLTVD